MMPTAEYVLCHWRVAYCLSHRSQSDESVGRREAVLVALLLAVAPAERLLVAWCIEQPGYTDAYYYAVGARQLYSGQGLDLPFIWNYLDPPESVPHSGYLYWMPLTSILGAMGMLILGKSYLAMQAPFVLLSALLPLAAYAIAWDLTEKRKHAMLAALLAVFPGFYALVFTLPDSFAPFALAGSLCLWTAGRGLRGQRPLWFGLAGLAAGFAHLARADGALLALVALMAALAPAIPTTSPTEVPEGRRQRIAIGVLMVLAGYLLVMGPWFARNWVVAGTPLGGSGIQTVFLTDYDDLFSYRRPLNLENYLAWGWTNILASKWQALVLNLQRLWVEGLLVFLLPFTALGLWRLRRDRLLWPFFVYFPLLFLLMTFVFTFPGMRGGLFHSGSALLPFLFAGAGPGLERALQWIARRRLGWQVQRAWNVFASVFVVLAILITTFALWRAGVLSGAWNERDWGYIEIGNWLDEQGAADAVVMVGDAPGFTWHTGHPAIAIPNEPWETILGVADRYGARYLVLDSKRPRTTDDVYQGRSNAPRLVLRHTVGPDRAWQVYEILP
jgi:hypothetical protein